MSTYFFHVPRNRALIERNGGSPIRTWISEAWEIYNRGRVVEKKATIASRMTFGRYPPYELFKIDTLDP